MTGDTGTCSQQGGNICGENEVCEGEFLEAGDNDFCCSTACVSAFSDAKTCEIKNSSIEIRIKNPNDNENFKVGDIIKAKIKIENKFDEKLNFDVEVYLYDLDEDESIEDKEENIKINEGESGTIELEIKIPEDVEGNNFAIYVFVEDDEYCNSDYVEIEIEREKHNVIIEDIEIFPQTVSSGGHVEVNVKVANIGGSDEDVYIEIENYLLNISEKSEEFEIEEYDEDDTEIKTFYINIPKDVEDGEYTIKASVIFDDGDDSASETFSVFTEKIFKQNETSQNAISLKPVSKDVKETSSSLLSFFVIAIFIISIGILVVLIVTAKKD